MAVVHHNFGYGSSGVNDTASSCAVKCGSVDVCPQLSHVKTVSVTLGSRGYTKTSTQLDFCLYTIGTARGKEAVERCVGPGWAARKPLDRGQQHCGTLDTANCLETTIATETPIKTMFP